VVVQLMLSAVPNTVIVILRAPGKPNTSEIATERAMAVTFLLKLLRLKNVVPERSKKRRPQMIFPAMLRNYLLTKSLHLLHPHQPDLLPHHLQELQSLHYKSMDYPL